MKRITSFLLSFVSLGQLKAITAEQLDFFESRIRPVLAQECYECHSACTKQKGGLLLDSRPGWQAGGDSGVVIMPGDATSLLLQSIRHEHRDLKMPKNGGKLDAKVISDFEKWITEGAFDPRDTAPTKDEVAQQTDWKAVLQRRKQWWSFQPLRNPQRAVLNAPELAREIDKLLLEKINQSGLKPAPRADARTLIRRASYILTGLPPTPEEAEAFEQSSMLHTQPAFTSLVDRLLATPAYGERWARHWLDWVRYAESYGSEGDPAIPYAWRYRDAVIRAFNDDVPYPQRVSEAIAGDLLAQPRIKGGLNESAIGIGQLRMVLHGFSPTDSLDEMVTFTDNQIDTVTKAFQGLTVSCARCHNHKFDAISQADFYALYGIFTSTHPAVVDVNAPGTGKVERAELARLKHDIKTAMVEAWMKSADVLNKLEPPAPAGPVSSTPLKSWNLSADKWFTDGQGIAQGATKAGEFSIAIEGEKILSRIHPGGIFSDLTSTKDRAVLMSPRFKCEGGTLWMRTAGGGGSKAKYVVQNYPCTGTIHKAKEFKDEGDATLGWHKLDLNYWKGDDIFIQVATAADMPAETKVDARSWFGITEVVITKDDMQPHGLNGSRMTHTFHDLVTAWQTNTLTDSQAEALNTLLQSGKLPNDAKKIPTAAPLLARYREIEARLLQPTRAPGVLEADSFDAALFVRGDHKQPSEIVPRRFLDGINPTPFKTTQSGRLELAGAIAAPENPLTARVIVNRLWHHVFGRGIVGTPDNFGRLGELPTHPELLDLLAQQFIASGGSMRQMIRALVLTEAFQRSAQSSPLSAQKDPENKLLSHWGIRRLEAEAIRDSIVLLSGKLELTLFGEPVNDADPRRSIYVKVIRNQLDPFLTAFDLPVPSSTRGRRDVTNVPAQSLALLNDPTVMKWASNWARTTLRLPDKKARVQRMFSEALGREATADEITASLCFVKSSTDAAMRQQGELRGLENEAATIQQQMDRLLGPARAKLTEQRPSVAVSDVPEPLAEWDFEKDANDLKGRLPLKLEGAARIEHGALVLDGRTASARSALLIKDLKAKTLEAWVLLDTLDQAGGGVVTVQDRRGGVFDSIVYAERNAREWLAGSDHHKRTQEFRGPVESDAAKRPVHVAITYTGGKVTGYRDGVLYGRLFKTEDEAVFKAGDAEVLLGCRHGMAGGNKSLRGRILRARLYDRALTSTQIESSRQLEASIITERDVLDSLNDADRANVRQWQFGLEKLHQQIATLETRLERLSPETAGWESLALSIINLKEFVYLR